MAQRYKQDYQIPGAFPEILRDLTLECLREQPKDIYSFCAEFFRAIEENRAPSYLESTMSRVSQPNPVGVEPPIQVPTSVDDVLNNGDDPLGDFVETYWGALLQKRDLMNDEQQERFLAIMSMIGDEDQKTG